MILDSFLWLCICVVLIGSFHYGREVLFVHVDKMLNKHKNFEERVDCVDDMKRILEDVLLSQQQQAIVHVEPNPLHYGGESHSHTEEIAEPEFDIDAELALFCKTF